MEPAEQYAALTQFDQDPTLAELERLLSEFNLFRLLGLGSYEETHSRILAWLLNPRENHRLGAAFLNKFLAATMPLARSGADWSAAQVQREWRNLVDGQQGFLDLLILDEERQFLCAIENKVRSGEHSGQLTRYRQALENRYPEFTRRYLFLSPWGTLAQDATEREHWQSVDYNLICQLVAETAQNFAASGSAEVLAFLRQYADLVRRSILGNEDARVVAWKIYRRHKNTIKFIYDHWNYCELRLQEILKETIENQAGWKLEPRPPQKEFTRFFAEEWTGSPVFETGTEWSHYPALILFQFRCQNDTLVVDIAISQGKDQAARDAVDSCLRKIIDPAKRREVGVAARWIVFDLSENILDKSDFEQWDETAIRAKLADWVSAFAQNRYPQIRDAVTRCLEEFESSGQP